MKERVNIYTIAKEAGVSPATVSRVMTNNAKVSNERRERVEAVIRKYGFTPNALAQGLSKARTKTIGMLISDISSPFYSRVAAECERAANKSDYILLMLSSLSDRELEMRHLMKLYEQQVDAIVIVGGRIDNVVADEQYVELINRIAATTPIIATGKLAGAENYQVCIDEAGSMDMAMEYLISLGHEKIALVGGWKDAMSTFEKRMRYRMMLRRHEIEVREEYVMESRDYSSESGYRCMKKLLAMEEIPTAVVAINDHTAAGIIRAIKEAGMRVPEDISLIAFDNTILSEALTPKLTAVGCNYIEFGTTLIETAITAIDSGEIPDVQVVPVGMAVRESCAPIRR